MKYFVYAFSALALISTATLTEASDQAKKDSVLKAMKPLGITDPTHAQIMRVIDATKKGGEGEYVALTKILADDNKKAAELRRNLAAAETEYKKAVDEKEKRTLKSGVLSMRKVLRLENKPNPTSQEINEYTSNKEKILSELNSNIEKAKSNLDKAKKELEDFEKQMMKK